jgi:GLPGLI family protein
MKATQVFLGTLFILFLSAPQTTPAQQLSGRVYYRASNQIMIRIDSAEMSPEEIAEAHQIMKKPWERDFILTFSQTESNWRQAETLAGSSDQSAEGELTISLSGSGNEILYKNLFDQKYVQEQEFMGREFLIQDALDPKNWELTGETKRIGDYTARKATFDQVIDSRRFSSGMEEMDQVKDTVRITAWFTPEIPVAHGPENYFGLPGLILEVHNGGRAFYCEKIELNPTANPVEIQIPKRGKIVSSKEFELMQSESIRQMENRYQGKPGEAGKRIRVGG